MKPEQLAELFVEEQCDNTMNIHTCIEILVKNAYKAGYACAVDKTEEYRIVKPYWCKRFTNCNHSLCWMRDNNGECVLLKHQEANNKKGYTHVRFRYGYTKRTMLREIESISIGNGKPEWGAPTDKQVFIIKFKKGGEQ